MSKRTELKKEFCKELENCKGDGKYNGSFYGKIEYDKINIRRASDDALLTVDLSTEKGKEYRRRNKGID